jgi:hypothetical protein
VPDTGSRRRMPGLRREEVALPAGVSSDYYVRLEQGRDQHPSQQVFDVLARAPQLDNEATAHLHRLATPPAGRRRKSPRPGKVPGAILHRVLEPDSRLRSGPLHGRARRQPPRDRGLSLLRTAPTSVDVDDPRLDELVGELSVRSERFSQLWARATTFVQAVIAPRSSFLLRWEGTSYLNHVG